MYAHKTCIVDNDESSNSAQNRHWRSNGTVYSSLLLSVRLCRGVLWQFEHVCNYAGAAGSRQIATLSCEWLQCATNV